MEHEELDQIRIDERIPLETFQTQCEYKLGVHVQKGKKLFGSREKAFYEAEWLDGNKSPIVLIERNGGQLCQEILFNISLSHRRIIKTYGLVDPNGHTVDKGSVLLLQEYAKSGDLGRLLSDKHFVPDQSVFVEIFKQIAEAMAFLAQNGIVHGDLGCRNVLVLRSDPHKPEENSVKLIDFGLTKNSSKSSNEKPDIPVRFAAPEILHNQGKTGYSEKSDVYAFAVFMHEACSFGTMPYKNINDDNDVWRQKLQGLKLTRPDNCDPNLWKLMSLCWVDQPEKRPTFQRIYEQLTAIQTIEISPRHSNPLLFPVEYKTCVKCNSRYTDDKSHTYTCSEEETICDICFQKYRRGNSRDHQRVCKGVIDENNLTQPRRKYDSALDVNMESTHPWRLHPLSMARDNTNHAAEYRSISRIDHLEGSDRQIVAPKRSAPATDLITRRSAVPTSRTTDRDNSSRSPVDLIPCEICNRSYPSFELKRHQAQCQKLDDERIEHLRNEIEQQNFTCEVECQYCNTEYPVKELDAHQKVCLANPENIPDTSRNGRNSLERRSNSCTDIFERTRPTTVFPYEPRMRQQSGSTKYLNVLPPIPKAPVKTETNILESGLQRLISRIRRFFN